MIIPNLKCGKDERQPPKKRAKACLTLTVDAESQKSGGMRELSKGNGTLNGRENRIEKEK